MTRSLVEVIVYVALLRELTGRKSTMRRWTPPGRREMAPMNRDPVRNGATRPLPPLSLVSPCHLPTAKAAAKAGGPTPGIVSPKPRELGRSQGAMARRRLGTEKRIAMEVRWLISYRGGTVLGRRRRQAE